MYRPVDCPWQLIDPRLDKSEINVSVLSFLWHTTCNDSSCDANCCTLIQQAVRAMANLPIPLITEIEKIYGIEGSQEPLKRDCAMEE